MGNVCEKKEKVCVCAYMCVFGVAECILCESALLRSFHTEQWVQLCCASLCWQMIQWLYCESIVKFLSRLLSQSMQRNRLTKHLHFVLDPFCMCVLYQAETPAWKCHLRPESWFFEDTRKHVCGSTQRRALW